MPLSETHICIDVPKTEITSSLALGWGTEVR